MGKFSSDRRITIRLPDDLARSLDRAAETSDLTVSAVVKGVLALSLEHLAKPTPLTKEERNALRVVIRYCELNRDVRNEGLKKSCEVLRRIT